MLSSVLGLHAGLSAGAMQGVACRAFAGLAAWPRARRQTVDERGTACRLVVAVIPSGPVSRWVKMFSDRRVGAADGADDGAGAFSGEDHDDRVDHDAGGRAAVVQGPIPARPWSACR